MTAPAMTADDTIPAAVAETGATMTAALPEAIDAALDAALEAARRHGAAAELAWSAVAHGLDGGPFWTTEARRKADADTARLALRLAIADALAAAERRRLAEAAAVEVADAMLAVENAQREYSDALSRRDYFDRQSFRRADPALQAAVMATSEANRAADERLWRASAAYRKTVQRQSAEVSE